MLFDDVPALAGHGCDCRLLSPMHDGERVPPGAVATEVALCFLFEADVLPHLAPGTGFRLWEGRVIGQGRVLRIGAEEPSRAARA